MPFTVSHAAVALFHRPLRLPLAPLAIGAMSPDLPYFIGVRQAGHLTHSLPGALLLAVPAALVLTTLWSFVIRPAVHDLAPEAIRRRWVEDRPSASRRRTAALTIIAACSGVLSHIVWDSFTHESSWGTRSVAWLNSQQGILPGYKWAQYGGGVLGLAAIFIALLVWWRRSAHRVSSDAPMRLCNPRWRAALLCGPVLLGTLVALVTLFLRSSPLGSPQHVFTVITATMGAGTAGVIACAVVWHILVSRPPDARVRRSDGSGH